MPTEFTDKKISSELCLWTTDLDKWMQKYMLIDHNTSMVFARTENGQLMKVTSVSINSTGDLEIGIGKAL